VKATSSGGVETAGGGATTPAGLPCAVPRGRERRASATAPGRGGTTPPGRGGRNMAAAGAEPARGGDGGSKGQRRRREQARLEPKNRGGEGGFGVGAAEDFAVREEDFAPEVGESAREQGDGGPAPLGKKSEAGEEMARPIASGEG